MSTIPAPESRAGRGILTLYWKIATQPVLYKALAENPYLSQTVKIGLKNFPNSMPADIIFATALAEPEGKHDREFKKLSPELQKLEFSRQNARTLEIAQNLNTYVKTNVRELWRLSPGLLYKRLFDVVFEINDLRELEQSSPQKQRINLRLLIIKYIEIIEEHAPVFEVPRLKLLPADLKIPSKTFLRRKVLTKQSFLAVYASTALVFISIPVHDFLKQTSQTHISGKTLGIEAEKEITGAPLRLQIPAAGIDADIKQIGINSKGEMEVPDDTFDAGWYKFGPRPGEIGSAVISGHFDPRKGRIGVFDNLDKLKPGDLVTVTNDLGKTFTFTVRESRIYDPGYAEDVFLSTDNAAHLNLITCDGAWDKVQKSYDKRLVVFADTSEITTWSHK